MKRCTTFQVLVALTLLVLGATALSAQMDPNEPGILEPVTSAVLGMDIRVPNTDQSVDGDRLSNVKGDIVFENAFDGNVKSLLGHTITRVESPNRDMFLALEAIDIASQAGNVADMRSAAQELEDILLGKTEGRIYDGYGMLNFNRWQDRDVTGIGPEHFPPDVLADEYKMKVAQDSGETFVSPFDGETRRIWEIDINMIYYDGQIDSDTFLVRFPVDADKDDTLQVNYRIYSLVEEDFSPTLVMLDRRMAQNTVSFPFKGFDAVWVAFFPGDVVNLTVKYPPVRMIRGVYTWGWRVHPPRIQFLQPVYEITNAHTGEVELDPQGISFAVRNREDLTLDAIGDAAPEMKMYQVTTAILNGESPETISAWMNDPNQGPAGVWYEWGDLAEFQQQLPEEAWELLEAEGIRRGDFGPYQMVSVFLNNEMYGDGPFKNEIRSWQQGDVFRIKLINLDDHTHYFRNVDFGPRIHDDILRCCGGGETSFEVMNFKPSYGAPKVAEMQWRAGWGFRPHYDVIQQQEVFSRAVDRVKLTPYTDGNGEIFTGYQYSPEARGGDFRFSPPPFVITDVVNPAESPLRDVDGQPGLVIGQHTEGYGVGNMCPNDPFPGFCLDDIALFNPNGVLNWPPPPLQGATLPDGTVLPDHPTELRFPPFLRNPDQGSPTAGDIIPPTGAWRPFLWTNPANGSLFIDPNDPSKGHWADLTYSHGAPVFANDFLNATVELPRAAGQLFYQFDDLFHDNSIFSPHPVFEGFDSFDLLDQVENLRARIRGGDLRVRGRLTELPTGEFASWVMIFNGRESENGCTGTLLGNARVDAVNGRFIFRQADSGLASQSNICVRSAVGGFASASTN